MTEIVRLDHRIQAVAEQIVDRGAAGRPARRPPPPEAEARRIEVMTSTGNTPAISLYLQAGYVIVDRDDAGPVPVSHFARSRPNGDGTVG